MSAKTRADLAKLRQRYARNFQVDLALVEAEEWADGEGKVWCPSKPELPTWTLNESEGTFFGHG